MFSFVIIVFVLLVIINKIGYIVSVNNVIKMMGVREVMVEVVLGLLLRNVWRGFMKFVMFVRDVRVYRREMGNIYRKVGCG